ncbi:hypothetical protein PMAYCL1PPCAC_14562, partial [Pristionchus mayeri]
MLDKLIMFLTIAQISVSAIATTLFIWLIFATWNTNCSSQKIAATFLYAITIVPSILEIVFNFCSYRLVQYKK